VKSESLQFVEMEDLPLLGNISIASPASWLDQERGVGEGVREATKVEMLQLPSETKSERLD